MPLVRWSCLCPSRLADDGCWLVDSRDCQNWCRCRTLSQTTTSTKARGDDGPLRCACLERWGGRPLLLLCLFQHILTEWLSPMWSVSNRFSQGDSTSPASGSGSAYGIENIFKRTRIQYGFVGLWCLTFINLNWVCVWVLCWMDRSFTRLGAADEERPILDTESFEFAHIPTYSEARFY